MGDGAGRRQRRKERKGGSRQAHSSTGGLWLLVNCWSLRLAGAWQPWFPFLLCRPGRCARLPADTALTPPSACSLWSRFFCLSVYITMYLNDHQRTKFYEVRPHAGCDGWMGAPTCAVWRLLAPQTVESCSGLRPGWPDAVRAWPFCMAGLLTRA